MLSSGIKGALFCQTPHTTRASPGSWDGAREGTRNDAVVGSSSGFVSPGPLFQEEDEIAQRNAPVEILDGRRTFSSRFLSVDELPLDPMRGASRSVSERCDNQNQYFLSQVGRKFDVDEAQTGSLDTDIVLGGFRFPTLSEGFDGGGEISERRTSGIQNVTMRETKRPKEREKDKEYRRLT